nr:hypothetical protein [Candidatus Freyarchaeota archaeon]
MERNKGNWSSKGIAVLDLDGSVIGSKGDVPKEHIEYYHKFPLRDMAEGSSLHFKNSFMMKITEFFAVVVVLSDEHFARLSAINLWGRIAALHDLYRLDEEERKKVESQFSILGKLIKKVKSDTPTSKTISKFFKNLE